MTTIGAPPHESSNIEISHESPSPRGRRFLALCASLFLAGLGHALAGKWRRGLFWLTLEIILGILLLLALAYARFTPTLFILLPLVILQNIFMWVDACITARRSRAAMLGHPLLRYGLGIIFLTAIIILPSPGRHLAIPFRQFVANAFAYSSKAMSPTLQPGDKFIASRLEPFSRWSAIVFRSPEDGTTFYVSRIAGLPGETIEVKDKAVFINGHPIPSPAGIHYVGDDPRNHQGVNGKPMKLGPDEYFVLSDNSPVAADSRYWKAAPGHQPGAVPADYIYGPVTWIYWPISHIKRIYGDASLTSPMP